MVGENIEGCISRDWNAMVVKGGRNDSISSGLSSVNNDYWVLITRQKAVQVVETKATLNKMNKVPVLVEFVIESGMQAYKKVLLL